MVSRWCGSGRAPVITPPGMLPTPSPQPRNECSGCLPRPMGPPGDCLSRLSHGSGASVLREKLEPRPSSGRLPRRRLNGHSVCVGIPSQCLRPHCPAQCAPPCLRHGWLLLSSSVPLQRGPLQRNATPPTAVCHSVLSPADSDSERIRTFSTNTQVHFQTHQRWATGGVVTLQGQGLLVTPQHSSALPMLGPHGSLRRSRNTVTG